jgi:hypothetical protein
MALADWLEENGQADRAEFIRVQLALAALARDDWRFRPIFKRELELLSAHKDAWFGTFRSAWRYYDCRRGFIEEVWGPAESVLHHADWFVAHHALQQVRLKGTMEQLAAFLRSPLPSVLQAAYFSREDVGTATLQGDKCTEPLARRPLHLGINLLGSGDAFVTILTALPLPARLGTLDLSANLIGADYVWPLLNALERCPMLTSLNLSGGYYPRDARGDPRPNIGEDGIIYLADHPLVARLQAINLAVNEIGPEGVRALVESPHLRGNQHLILGEDARQLPVAQRRILRQHFGSRLFGLIDG